MTATRVIIHNDDPAPLLARMHANGAAVEAQTCDSYAELGAQLAAFRPDVVYSVRLQGPFRGRGMCFPAPNTNKP